MTDDRIDLEGAGNLPKAWQVTNSSPEILSQILFSYLFSLFIPFLNHQAFSYSGYSETVNERVEIGVEILRKEWQIMEIIVSLGVSLRHCQRLVWLRWPEEILLLPEISYEDKGLNVWVLTLKWILWIKFIYRGGKGTFSYVLYPLSVSVLLPTITTRCTLGSHFVTVGPLPIIWRCLLGRFLFLFPSL